MEWHTMMSIPFMALQTGTPKLSGTRIAEALIIAAVTAWATSYITVAKLETKTELRAEYTEKQFNEQRDRRDKEIDQLRATMSEESARRQVQYEALRADTQKIALAVERISTGKIR